jgi:P63C domain
MADGKSELTVSEMAAMGGKARAKAMTPEERQQSAQQAIEARWNKGVEDRVAVSATHSGTIIIGDLEIPCGVLEDGTRVLSERGVMKALGVGRSGYAHNRAKEDGEEDGAALPLFVAPINLKPFVDLELASVLKKPIWYRPTTGRNAGHMHKGVRADMMPRICNVWLKARDAGVIRGKRQAVVVLNADIISRGLAEVGITALVDEATGFQDQRARDALAKILEQFVAKELRRWVKTFPLDYFKELCRLREVTFSPAMKLPRYFGCLTNDIVYSRLAPGVLPVIQKKNPPINGRRKSKNFQWLTEDVGEPRLREHLWATTALMKAFRTWDEFYAAMNRALPKQIQWDEPLFEGLD